MGLSDTQHMTLVHVVQSEQFSGPGSKSNRGAVWMANKMGRGVPRVQQTLDSLEELGLIEQDGTGPALTDRGRQVLADGTESVSFERDPADVERELLAELESDSNDDEDSAGLLARLTNLFG